MSEYGVNYYILKPFDLSDLENSLDYAIANKWSEFTNEYNKIAYMFGAVEKEIDKPHLKIYETLLGYTALINCQALIQNSKIKILTLSH